MKNSPLYIVAAVIGLCFSSASAQDISMKIPEPSTSQRIEQEFGLGKISIVYSRPNTKGRKIIGETEPYGIVWRTGANSATRLKLTDTIQIEGHTLPAGEYALFTIPGAKEWTVILNNTFEQWGAYAYDSTKDALRFKVKPGAGDKKVETLTFGFTNMTSEHGELQLSWEQTVLTLRLDCNVDARVMANIDRAMLSDKKPLYRAAIYYYNHDKDLHKALAWMQESDKQQPNSFNIKYWLAKIELKMGDKAAAISLATEGKNLATAEKNPEYIRMNTEVLTAAKAN